MRRLHKPVRYQLKKEAAQVLRTGHPWIYRTHLSSAAKVFASGQWLKLVDADNSVLGYGIYDPDGLIGIRVLKEGETEPNVDFLKKKLSKALARREMLRKYSDGFRAIHGENDGFPGIVLDVYGDTGVLQTYAASVDRLGRYVAAWTAEALGLKKVVWKLPAKRSTTTTKDTPVRLLRGTPPGVVPFREGKMKLSVDPWGGQKSGAFLDLRALRKWLAAQKLAGRRVLNLFSYTGTLGLAAETAGASEIWNVDISDGALQAAKKFHTLDAKHHRFVKADVFTWLDELPPNEMFDLVIVDPPNMASRIEQVPGALKAYRKLFHAANRHLKPKGTMVVCCCTSRIERTAFTNEAKQVLGPRQLKASLAPEDDHPVGFKEGDYLKVLVFS
jgi:23S rRNA (cytosine1962-C5)-methyltransferase